MSASDVGKRKQAAVKRGRPPLPPGDVRLRNLVVRLTTEEKVRICAAAKRDRAALSKWARAALLNYALPLDAALLEEDALLHEARVTLREYCAETREAPITMREAALLSRLCTLMGVEDEGPRAP